jgi:hypothetical protein
MVGGSSPEADKLGSAFRKRRPNMEYFVGLDVSMEETHVCVLTRSGAVIYEAKVASTPASIAAALARAPACRQEANNPTTVAKPIREVCRMVG